MMLAGTIWQREFVEFAQRRRALVIKLAFPLLVAIPLVLSGAPSIYAAMALTMLTAIVGALGAGAVLTRERQTGLTLRYRTLPVTPGRLLIERLSTNVVIDFGQLIPVLVLIALRHPSAYAWWPALLLTTAAVLLIGNLMGAVASSLSQSPGEVMLYVVIPLLPLLYLSGVFTPLSQPALLVVSRLLPFSYLHEALLGALGGQPTLPPWETLLAGLGFLVGAAGLTGRLRRRVFESD
ncbi:MAG: ABC transporter permease [Chloroflexi bacterium]|nr:MAG: ABC transporter permease [Chloroflexota bacterium]